MGFFSGIADIIGAALPIIGNVLLPGAGGALGAAVGGVIGGTPPIQTAVTTVGAFGGTLVGQQAATNVALGTAALAAQGACPTGTLRRRTIVQTFDPRTGAVTKQEIQSGAPAVMQSDVAAANRLNRALRRLNKKQPKRLVRESPVTQLKNEVVESALRKARDANGGVCPS